jgi:hypothetical protein
LTLKPEPPCDAQPDDRDAKSEPLPPASDAALCPEVFVPEVVAVLLLAFGHPDQSVRGSGHDGVVLSKGLRGRDGADLQLGVGRSNGPRVSGTLISSSDRPIVRQLAELLALVVVGLAVCVDGGSQIVADLLPVARYSSIRRCLVREVKPRQRAWHVDSSSNAMQRSRELGKADHYGPSPRTANAE